MEEIKLFNQLNFLKNEIEKDLSVLNTLQCDLMLKDVYEKNRTMCEKLTCSQNEFEVKIEEFKNENLRLEKELEKKANFIFDKESQIKRLNENIKDILEENKRINLNNCDLKSNGFIYCFILFA